MIARNEIQVSEHGYDELAADNILIQEILAGVQDGVIVEDYPGFFKGPCVLVLQQDSQQQPIHVLWGIPKNKTTPAVIVTAYRPNSENWTDNFKRRKK